MTVALRPATMAGRRSTNPLPGSAGPLPRLPPLDAAARENLERDYEFFRLGLSRRRRSSARPALDDRVLLAISTSPPLSHSRRISVAPQLRARAAEAASQGRRLRHTSGVATRISLKGPEDEDTADASADLIPDATQPDGFPRTLPPTAAGKATPAARHDGDLHDDHATRCARPLRRHEKKYPRRNPAQSRLAEDALRRRAENRGDSGGDPRRGTITAAGADGPARRRGGIPPRSWTSCWRGSGLTSIVSVAHRAAGHGDRGDAPEIRCERGASRASGLRDWCAQRRLSVVGERLGVFVTGLGSKRVVSAAVAENISPMSIVPSHGPLKTTYLIC